jgi:hypothetical protein
MAIGVIERTAEDPDDNRRGGIEGLVVGPSGLTDPGAAEVGMIDVSQAPQRVGFYAIGGMRRDLLRPSTGHIALVHQVPSPDGHGGFTFSDGTPNIDIGQSRAPGSAEVPPFGQQPTIL